MSKPNIIFILSDQHNASVLGGDGNEYVKTDNLDKLANNGTMLTNCYSNSPLCVPSRSSMLTGLLPHKTGIINNMQNLPTHKTTFVHSLAVAGYETVLNGRMHFHGPDQRHGYEKRFVGDITPSFPGIDNEYEIYGEFMRSSHQSMTAINNSGAGNSAVLSYDKDVADSACRYIKERDDERPLFMTIGFYGPHCPYISPPDLFNYYYNTLPEPEEISEEFRDNVHDAIKDWYKNRDLSDITKEDIKRVRAAYYGMVTYLDRLIGNILDSIEDNLDLENTLIIYASDHGDNIGENGLFWKTNFYEGSSRVPAIFNWKGVIPENNKISGLTSLLDIAPTLLNITNSPELPEYDGKNIFPNLLNEEKIENNRAIMSELGDIKGDMPSAMIRKNDYKLVLHYGYDTPQLFNLIEDPEEKNNLAEDDKYKKICNELKKELLNQWDPDKAYKKFEIEKKNAKLLKKWANLMQIPPLEEWRGNINDNYLISKKPKEK